MHLEKLTAAALLLSASAALADGTHAHPDDWEIGRPGRAEDVVRTVEITMLEPEEGGMAFEPGELAIPLGETVRFLVTNVGALEHEIVFDTVEANAEHASVMRMDGDMHHEDPNAITLAPGESGELIWTFSQPGAFQFACMIGGHMEAGTHGPLTVN